MASSDGIAKKRNNYKLLVDPELKKGAKKVYRINGKDVPGFPSVGTPRDPRTVKTVLGLGAGMDLKIPRFKFDKHWVGNPPERDLFVIGLTDVASGSALREVCESVGPVHSLKLHKSHQTKAFVGAATVCFERLGDGRRALGELDKKIVGGCYLRAELDDSGEHSSKYLEPLPKKEPAQRSKQRTSSQDSLTRVASDSETRTRSSSLAESISESEHEATPSTKPSDPIASVTNQFPFSSLHMLSALATPTEVPCTPGSIDSGISLRTQHSIVSPEPRRKPSFPLPPIPDTPPPPDEKAPPPLDAPPPLPPPTAIEKIGSDEEEMKQTSNSFESGHKFDPSLGLQSLLSRRDKTAVTPPSYELEVEEISGDESPVMVYFEPLEVESVSDDDMEVCSDDEGKIELNVRASTIYEVEKPVVQPPMIFPPRVFFPPLPPAAPFIIPPVPPSYPPRVNGFSRHRPNVGSSRIMSKSKLLREFSPPSSKKDSLSQDVLFKAIEQLRMIVLNDVQKKIVESSAYPVLDSHWEKRQQDKRALSDAPVGEGEKPSRQVQPYRRMLPGMKLNTDTESTNQIKDEDKPQEDEEDHMPTPRKRLLNFKIPLVRGAGQRRDQALSLVARRRLFGGQEVGGGKGIPPSKKEPGYYEECSDISSSENFSSDQSDGSWESDQESSPEPTRLDREKEYREIFGESSDSESNFEDFVAKNKSNKRTSGYHSDESYEDTPPPKKKARTVKLKRKPQSKKKPADIMNKADKENHQMVISKKFKARTPQAEELLIDEWLLVGLSKEEVQMMKLALGRLKSEGAGLVGGVSWAHYPDTPRAPPKAPIKRKRGASEGVEPADHVTGCARSEGYYKITMREKVKYLPHHRLKNTTTHKETKNKSSGRVNRANQRKNASLFSAGDMSSDLVKYNQLKARKKQLKFAKSTIHNWGLFAMESIAADEMIIEYVGQMVRQAVADEREKRYEAAGIGSSYLFRVDHDYIIDATRRGNLARFINHCCDPNCYAKVITVGALKKIVIYSKRDIAMGEEITYDYKFPIEDEKIPCLCGAPMCRGTLN